MTSEVQSYLAQVQSRFGISNLHENYCYHYPSKRGIYMASIQNQPDQIPEFQQIKFDSVGLFFMKTNIRFPKLSTGAALLLGYKATMHKVTVTKEQRDLYLQKETFEIISEQMHACEDTGYVLVYYQDICLGVGLLFWRDGSTAHLRSLFPRM